MKSMKNYLKDVYIPEELTISERELKEEEQLLFEEFRKNMLEANPKFSEKIIKAQFERYFIKKG